MKLDAYNNPYYYWWKVRKFWKIPKLHLAHIGKITWFYGLPCRYDYYNRIFDVRLSGLGWKDKDDSPRFEWDPYLCFTFFRKWQIIFIWNFCRYFMKKEDPTYYRLSSEQTWETILYMTNYDKNIADACHSVGFYKPYERCDDPDYYIPPKSITMFRNLSGYGWEQYYKTPRSKELKD